MPDTIDDFEPDGIEPIEFLATLAPNGAITFNSDGDARIKFESDGSQMASVAQLLAVLRGKMVKVTVSLCEDGDEAQQV